ncbi:glycoside hydrolase family 3 C-terminal domain-containing protein [Dactylosporangium matsuzakiense]|uniref:Sugar hydrolase n=1 Tax=Dactylosporangium matsuzakiense TaxID=53360 RepID=A0A9W6NKR1_9ACTN|nr:glycoside hydrolase family 3 C-terminal domain-containing protein [Dactylosporangium matsuzakiense]UWZ42527.1 glycoside hydrolase family 3 C-terminal domain-containing protein [Dactylosporangium matsuzakiense]GLL00554.1 sugar hydrolase [Dactylosporangium matsuzakiense]
MVADLLSRLTLAEKIAMLHQTQPAVPRLGLEEFHTGCEVVHGAAWMGRATVFPQAVGLGATFDRALLRAVATAAATEVRAFHHDPPPGAPRASLNVWGPVVNPLRDPRWGRNEEGYSEDPLATAELAIAYCAGLRGPDPHVWRTAPVLKHFLAYNVETSRDVIDVRVPERVLHEYELPVFVQPLRSGLVAGVMPAYNLVDGVPNHVHPLLATVLRAAHPDVVICSDAYAPTNLATSEHYFPTHAESHAAALRAGVDSYTDNGTDRAPTIERFTQALALGLITEADIDAAVGRVLAMRASTGEFDPGRDPYAGTTREVIACTDHARLAAQAARAALVLLKNDAGALPLHAPATVAVVGPLGGRVLRDWYSGSLPYAVSIESALRDRLGPDRVLAAEGLDQVRLLAPDGRHVHVSPDGALALADGPGTVFTHQDWGTSVQCPQPVHTLRASTGYLTLGDDGVVSATAETPDGWVVRELWEFHPVEDGYALRNPAAPADQPDLVFRLERVASGVAEAVAAARAAERAIVVLGNDPHINGRETVDRDGLALPPEQEALLRAVAAANPATTLVLVSSYPYAVDWAAAHVPAILWTAHGGQEQGNAIADALLGAYNPGGRLPQTWYRSDEKLPSPLDYDVIGSGWTYQWHRGTPLFPFGHGLSYTTFEYGPVTVTPGDTSWTATVAVTNTGTREGDEVVQLYATPTDWPVPAPRRRLAAFERITLTPGETRTVTLTIPAWVLSYWHDGRLNPPTAGYTFTTSGE